MKTPKLQKISQDTWGDIEELTQEELYCVVGGSGYLNDGLLEGTLGVNEVLLRIVPETSQYEEGTFIDLDTILHVVDVKRP